MIFVAFFITSIFNMTNAYAQTTTSETEPDELELLGWTFGAGLSYFSFDQEAAEKQLIGDTAFSLDLTASYYFAPRLAASAGIGLLQLDDEDKFTQQVTDISGSNVETASSDARGIHYYGELLYTASNASSTVQIKGGAGFSSIGGADRSIKNCVNCEEKDIDLTGGAYATASVYRGIANDQYNVGLSARQYFGGDIKNTATLWFEYIY